MIARVALCIVGLAAGGVSETCPTGETCDASGQPESTVLLQDHAKLQGSVALADPVAPMDPAAPKAPVAPVAPVVPTAPAAPVDALSSRRGRRKPWPRRVRRNVTEEAMLEMLEHNGTAMMELNEKGEWWWNPSPPPPPAPERPLVSGACNIKAYDLGCSYDQFNSRRRRWRSSRRREPAQRPAAAGHVSSVYTQGMPRLSDCPLLDELRPECCFDGLRVVTKTESDTFDPVTLVGGLVGYKQPESAVMELGSPDDADQLADWTFTETQYTCGQSSTDKHAGVFDVCWSFGGCHEEPYWAW